MITAPPVVFIPPARDDVNGSHYFGPYAIGANLYAVMGTSTFSFLSVWKSTDNGVTWNRLDQSNAPNIVAEESFDMILVGGTVFYILVPTISEDGMNVNLEVITFDTGTDTYGPYLGPGIQNTSMPRLSQFANGDLLVAYFDTSLPGPSLVIFSGGVWGAVTNFIASVLITGLIIGADDIARLFYYTHGFPAGPISVFMRTFTHGGVLGGQSAVFSSTYRANQEIGLFNEMPVGRMVIWNNNLILPYYGNPAGSGKQAGIYIGTPYNAPVWAFLLADTLTWAGTALDSYGYAFIDSGNNLYLFWCANDPTNNIGQIYYAVNPGAGFGAPVLYYDLIANPPAPLGPSDPVWGTVTRTLGATLYPDGKLGAISSATAGCASFYLGVPASPQPPAPPSPPTYWNPGSSESLLCEKHYPWSVPPKDRIPVQARNSIPAPAVNVLTEMWSYEVPDGFWFVYDRLMFVAEVTGFIEGAGTIIFTLDVNIPTIGTPLPVGRPLAKFTTNIGELSEMVQVAPVQLYQGDILRAKVLVTDGTVGVGLPNVITAAVEGWLFPHSRNL